MSKSIEIAQILLSQKKNRKRIKSGFDLGLLGLGVGINTSGKRKN